MEAELKNGEASGDGMRGADDDDADTDVGEDVGGELREEKIHYSPPMEYHPPPHTESLETCVRHRHSIRFYKPDPVPAELIRECVALAQLAPSNSNIQPWRLHLASGKARERVAGGLMEACGGEMPVMTPIPPSFKHFRSEMGHKLYGTDGYNIRRDEPEKHKSASLRNFDFFGAPVVGVITMNRDLLVVDAMAVGMFVQTFMLALTERGVGTCLQVSVTAFAEVLKRELGVPEEEMVLSGIAIGFPAEGSKVNELVVSREEVDATLVLLEE